MADPQLAEFLAALDHTAEGLALLRDGRYVYVNESHAALYGYTKDEQIGLTWHALYEPDERRRIEEEYFPELMRDRVWRGICTGRRKDGSSFQVELNLSLLEPDLLVCSCRDVTDQELAKAREAMLASHVLRVSRIIESYTVSGDLRAASNELLSLFLETTGSAFGFVGETRMGPTGRPALHSYAITDISWDEETRRLYAAAQASGMVFSNMDTLFGYAIVNECLVISDDPANDPRAGGIPKGHPPLKRLACLPIMNEGRIIGLVGIANAPEPYSPDLEAACEPFIRALRTLIMSKQSRERQSATEALQNDLIARLNMAKRNVGIIPWEWDLMSGRITTEMPATWEYLYGAAPTTLQAWLLGVDAASRGPLESELTKVLHEGVLDVLVRTREHAGEASKIVRVIAASDPTNPGRRLIGLSWDVTTVEILRESDSRLRATFEIVYEGYIICRRSGSTYLVTDLNAAARSHLPNGGADAIGEPFLQVLPDSMRQAASTCLEALSAGSTVATSDFRVGENVEDESTRWFELAIQAVDIEDASLTIASFRDVSLSRRAALRLQASKDKLYEANARLAEAAAVKDEFLANMSHELRTPLNIILGYCELAMSGDPTSGDGGYERAFAAINDSAEHLLRLINDVLDMTKVEAGKLEFLWESVSVESLCAEIRDAFGALAREKAIVWEVSNDAPPTAAVTTDRYRLRQIIFNLLSNAVKFSPVGGQVRVRFAPDASGESLRIAVRDEGPGIPVAQQARLFKPFTQLDGGLTRQHEGAGLGLCLVRKLVELHGGHVQVESVEGQGSEFTVVVPWDRFSHTTPSGPSAPLAGSRHLVLDANVERAEQLALHLRARGCDVLLQTSDLEELMANLRGCPDAVYVDIDNRHMSASEIRALMREQCMQCGPLLVALSSVRQASQEWRREWDIMLSQPFDSGQLIELEAAITQRACG